MALRAASRACPQHRRRSRHVGSGRARSVKGCSTSKPLLPYACAPNRLAALVYNRPMQNLNGFAAWLTLALGLLATLLVIISGNYWALAICAVVLLVDVAAVVPGLWLPPLQRRWGRARGRTPAADARRGAAYSPARKGPRLTHLPRRGDVCEVIEIHAYNPNSRSVVRFHQGSRRSEYTIARNPDDALQILGQHGWSIFASGTDAATARRYWVLNRPDVPNRATDDALPHLQ